MSDMIIKCAEKTCQQEFIFTEGEQAFYEARQFTPPKRCKVCREKRKQEGRPQGA